MRYGKRRSPGRLLGAAAYRFHRGGQVMVVIILAMLLLVGLIFYVYNTGELVNRRLAMQNAADSVAISGGTWMARTLNVAAMDNTYQARLLGLVPVFDALPLASKMAWEEMEAWYNGSTGFPNSGLRWQYNAIPTGDPGWNEVRNQMSSLITDFSRELEMLWPIHNVLNNGGFNMETVTTWNMRGGGGAPPHGSIWKAAVTLTQLSETTLETAGTLAQADAVRFGQNNKTDVAFLVPILPKLPYKKGTFEDFRPPLHCKETVYGDSALLNLRGGVSSKDQVNDTIWTPDKGGAIPDMVFPYRLGPWARLYRNPDWENSLYANGWRDYIMTATKWRNTPNAPKGPPHLGGGGSIIGGKRVGGHGAPSAGGSPDVIEWRLDGYNTFGPYELAMRQLGWFCGDLYNANNLRDTFFWDYIHSLGNIKLGYMFDSKVMKKVHYPQWITDYNKARSIGNDPKFRVYRTLYYQCQVISAWPEGDGRFLTKNFVRPPGGRAYSIWANGWVDPEKLGIPKAMNYIWKRNTSFETTAYEDLGLPVQTDPMTNERIPFTAYQYDWYIFCGIDVGGEIEVSNPCNYDQNPEDIYPMLIDAVPGSPETDYTEDINGLFRRQYFTYLGVVRRNDDAAVWRQRFGSYNPDQSMLTLAQVKVFNNSSFDLWTQDWQTQLTRVTDWSDWVTRLQRGLSDISQTEGNVSRSDAEKAYEFMSRLQTDAANASLNH